MTKLEQLTRYLTSALRRYRSEKGLSADAPVVLEFLGNDTVLRFHCAPEFIGTPLIGDLLFTGTALYKLVNSAPLELTDLVDDYDESFTTNLGALSTNFQSNALEFLALSVDGPAEVTGFAPVNFTCSVKYQAANGTVTYSGVAAVFSIVSGSEAATITDDGVLTPAGITTDVTVTLQARYITPQGNRFVQKTVIVKANSQLVVQGLEIFGDNDLQGGSSTTLVAAIRYTNGEIETVNPYWSVDRSFASITQDGTLTTRNVISVTATLNAIAEVSFNGQVYRATMSVLVHRIGQPRISTRYGPAPYYQTVWDWTSLFNAMKSGGELGTRVGQFTANSAVGSYVTLAYPADFGPALKIVNLTTGAEDDFNAPITVQTVFAGEYMSWLVYQTKFENKSGIWEVQ